MDAEMGKSPIVDGDPEDTLVDGEITVENILDNPPPIFTVQVLGNIATLTADINGCICTLVAKIIPPNPETSPSQFPIYELRPWGIEPDIRISPSEHGRELSPYIFIIEKGKEVKVWRIGPEPCMPNCVHNHLKDNDTSGGDEDIETHYDSFYRMYNDYMHQEKISGRTHPEEIQR